MGQEQETIERRRAFRNYQVNDALFGQARADAIFMHCLPAKRDEEVNDSIMEHPRSVIFHQAENRLHAQKALLLDDADLNHLYAHHDATATKAPRGVAHGEYRRRETLGRTF